MRRIIFCIAVIFVFFQFSIHMEGAIPASERTALIALYNATGGDQWGADPTWKAPPLDADGFSMPGTEGSWDGITVVADHVTEVRLYDDEDHRLRGFIPPELEDLPQLQVLHMRFIWVDTGADIPAELGTLTQLTELYILGYEPFTGGLSANLGNLTQLTALSILSGLTSFPVGIQNLPDLQILSLSNNEIPSLPTDIGNLVNLEVLDIDGNQLTSLPDSIGDMASLQILDLADNKIASLPTTIGNLSNLKSLSLEINELTSLPASIGDLSNLLGLDLRDNHLTTLPIDQHKLVSLQVLEIANNQIVLDIPSLAGLNLPPSLRAVNIDYNGLYVSDPAVKAEIDAALPGWGEKQTMPPNNVSAVFTGPTTAKVSWDQIEFTQFSGGYRVYYSTTSGGPWTEAGMTTDKNAFSYTVNGLSGGGVFYFMVRTETKSHLYNRNLILSGDSTEASAQYTPPPPPPREYTLTVNSSPDDGVEITVTPVDNSSNGDGTTSFSRVYDENTSVTLTAPAEFNGKVFSKWTVNETDTSSATVQVTMSEATTATAYYITLETPEPEIALSRNTLIFGGDTSGQVTNPQTVRIENNGTGTLDWTVSGDQTWLAVSPASGSNAGVLSVTADPTGLDAGTYQGVVTVMDPAATNSPQTIAVTLNVYDADTTAEPFGEFATPLDNSSAAGSIPVTGWVLDDIGIEHVKIHREESGTLVYIGDAVFVEGARPDVQGTFPEYSANYRAGWGYMLLTNFLPGQGNGTFVLHAVAMDKEGNSVTLGTKTINCNNADAVKPFGAIDTPAQGGTASGNAYINWGWALTPQPNYIPTDGLTISVWVNGVKVGSPVYNNYRSDIATLFPGYANTDGAVGYFYLDTTAYENGVHTIQWTVTDSGGNTDGIGSRYFTIENLGGNSERSSVNSEQYIIKSRKGMDVVKDDLTAVKEELERMEIALGGRVVKVLTPLPVGSTLNPVTGTFFWSPGAGFVGDYQFVFLVMSKEGNSALKRVKISIKPKGAVNSVDTVAFNE